VIRTLAKAAGGLLAVLAVLLGAWFAANRLLDEPVSPAQAALLAADNVPDRRNAAVGLLGLAAPRGADFMQHGVRVKEMYARNSPYEHIVDSVRGPRALRPTVENQQIICWLDPGLPLSGDCLPFDRAPAVLEENREILERYKSLYALAGYSAAGGYDFDAASVLAKLAVAEMQLYLRKGDAESAYREWRRALSFAKGNLRGTDGWVGKAMGLVMLGTTLPFLDPLLLADPAVARRHRAELLDVLRPDGVAAINPDGIARSEFRLLSRAFERPPVRVPNAGVDRIHWLAYHFGQKNRALNRYAAFAPEYAASLSLSWGEMEKESERLRKKHVFPGALEFILDPFGSALYAQFVDGLLKAPVMLLQVHAKDGQFRLATLLVRLINENVRDADIPAFLRAAGPGYYDPFSAAPARWDPKDRKIYFVHPVEKCAVLSFVRVREAGKGRQPPSPVNMRAC